jgi:hypothetical protein
MQSENHDLPPPVNHVFVDFENVHKFDLGVIGGKTVHFTLLAGAKQTKLDMTAVENLTQPGAELKLIRLTSSGKNALDFALAFYLGRDVLADPTGYFHIISKDKGYDPLVEHLRSKHIHAHRHDDFSTLTFGVAPKQLETLPQVALAKSKVQPKPTASVLDQREAQVLAHWRKTLTKPPRTRQKLISYLIVHLGHKLTEAEADQLMRHIESAGYLAIDDKGKVTYFLDRK